MKKYILLVLVLCLFASPVSADRNTSTIKGFTTSGLVKRGDVRVYSIDFIATANGGEFAIHDIDSPDEGSVANGSTTIKAEGKEATSGNGKHYDFSTKPLEFSNGLWLFVNSATVVIQYE